MMITAPHCTNDRSGMWIFLTVIPHQCKRTTTNDGLYCLICLLSKRLIDLLIITNPARHKWLE